MLSFESRLYKALETAIAKQGANLLAAVSGGADSTAMLAALAALRDKESFVLHCVHVEHGIRPREESRGDALAVRELCLSLKVPCRIISIPPGKVVSKAHSGGPGIEGAARFFRLQALRAERRRLKADWILTAHTKDDLEETILMRVLRGSGPAGLAPMPRQRGRMQRPLLDIKRQDVLDYLNERNIPFRTDSTNEDPAFLRNRIRLKLIPVLDNFFPSWRSSLLGLAETQALSAEFLESEVFKRIPWEPVVAENGSETGGLSVREEDFLNAPLILREESVLTGTDKLAKSMKKSDSRPRRAAVRRAVAPDKSGHVKAQDLGKVRLESRNGYIFLLKAREMAGEHGFSMLIKEPGFYTIKGSVLGSGKLDLLVHAFSFPLVFRNHAKGDCIIKGGHKRRFSDILERETRSRYTGVITVCDADGPAAFICLGSDLLVIFRDSKASGDGSPLFDVLGGKGV